MTIKGYKKLIERAYEAQARADIAMQKILDQLRKDGLEDRFGIQNQAGDGFVLYEDDFLYGIDSVVESIDECGRFDGRGGI